jgi:nucleoside-diphosphate-sugar epimerase
MANPVLVTGAAGRVGAVGRTVTELLLKQGEPVWAMVRTGDERAQAEHAGVCPKECNGIYRLGKSNVRSRFVRGLSVCSAVISPLFLISFAFGFAKCFDHGVHLS